MNCPGCKIHVKFCVGAIIAAVVLQAGLAGAVVGDGARAYQLTPRGYKTVSVYGLFTDGNMSLDPGTIVKSADLDVNVGVLMYTQTFGIKGQQAAVFGVLPYGEVKGSLDMPLTTRTFSSSGFGDAQVGGVFGLVGTPSLLPKQYVAFKPSFSLGVLTKVGLPTGSYEQDQALNVGANRWFTQIGLPVTYIIGESFLDPALLGFEALPSITFYTDNDAPFGADKSEQKPLFTFEAHVTRNLNKALWLAVDAIYTHGGETTTDGVAGDNTQNAFYLGGTACMALSKKASVKITYGGVVDRNDNGADGHMLRAIANYSF